MTDKELDMYKATVEPNFYSHIERGTIEMNNEYFNLIEEKMARLISENQELKRQLKEMKAINNVLSKELTSDKAIKQDYLITCYGIPISEIPKLAEENKKMKNQQKEFIEWLEKESKELIRDLGYHQRICLDILEKYKEIIGGKYEEDL